MSFGVNSSKLVPQILGHVSLGQFVSLYSHVPIMQVAVFIEVHSDVALRCHFLRRSGLAFRGPTKPFVC